MSLKHFDVTADGEVDLKITPDGAASAEPITVMQRFKETVEKVGDRPALCVSRDGAWQQWTWRDFYEDVKMAGRAFIKLGLDAHHAVGIIGFNSPEWFIADLGAIFAGGFATGIYTTNGPEAIEYVVNHSKTQIIVAEDKKQLDKILQVHQNFEHLKAIVLYNDTVPDVECTVPILDWDEFMRHGADVPDFELGHRMSVQKPGQCCMLIYTSGTTGNPKGVMITHDNVTWTSATLAASLPNMTFGKEHIVSYLPLSHIAAQILDMHAPMILGATVWFAQPTALKGTLVQTLQEVRPTVFLGVPRVWEKIEEKMRAVGSETTGLKKKIGTWAKRKGLDGAYAIQQGRPVPSGWGVAKKLVFSKVRKALGLDRCKFFATAAAPISKDTLEYFLSINIPIMEVYGMSENTGPQSLNIPGKHRTGSVGLPLAGTELKIHEPDQDGNGEICFRGRHICKGYMYNEEKTRESIDAEGWLHSGDIGRVDEDGYLYITGRIKEIIITAGGENVAPVPIENLVKENCPIISNCMLIGDRRKFLSLLVCLKSEVDPETTAPLDELTPQTIEILEAQGSKAKTVTEAMDDEHVLKYIQAGIDEANKHAVSRAQKVQKFKILPRDFSVPGGELGPTLKLRRPIVVKQYEELIDSFYA
ncbi:AMP dependent ligase [Salpingoeca rosetta]|uniref:AMP dependent ligase n=1 Tax=Salpingoeca rosetta (strain ATCC 50818 / BSB-021) TaxID=946362 RepID=F2UAC6_SALR5|nr:AMP dependent ligase [Salpingoeca rosetta]EGD73701.1 AMP dependent ligase [Salpingoeca rosetta]|eukprot:XP_004993982.1 AMP dependent ligase [Salpingoeca rosetta]